jgi:hypothetical protein
VTSKGSELYGLNNFIGLVENLGEPEANPLSLLKIIFFYNFEAISKFERSYYPSSAEDGRLGVEVWKIGGP